MIITNLFSLVLATSQLWAANCKSPELKDFRFYSLSFAFVHHSQFEGLSGAASAFVGRDFKITTGRDFCAAVTAGDTVNFVSSHVHGPVEAGSRVALEGSAVEGSVTSQQISISNSGVDGFLISEKQPDVWKVGSKGWMQKPVLLSVSHESLSTLATAGSVDWAVKPRLKVDCKSLSENQFDQNPVVEISAKDFKACRSIRLQASPSQQVVINIRGSEIAFEATDVDLLGGVKPEHILWNMPEATTLLISKTKHAGYGLPGTVLAPYALAEFYDGLITGSLIVGGLYFDEYQHPQSSTGKVLAPPSSSFAADMSFFPSH